MRIVLNHSIFSAVFILIAFGNLFIPVAQATEGLPSQKARFAGMGSTFKAKIKEPSSDSSINVQQATSEDNESLDEDSSSYFQLHTFVVNVVDQRDANKLLFLTLEVFCKINEPDDKWLIDNHLAPIKDSIITYVSGIERQKIQTQKQKKAMQKELTQRVSIVLKQLTGKNVLADLYLTRIIIQ